MRTNKIGKGRIISRLFCGILHSYQAIISVINKYGRDAENRRRFPHAIIEDNVCMTQDTVISDNAKIMSGCIVNHSSIGQFTYVSENSIIQNTSIGNYCSISRDLNCGLGRHPLDMFSTSPLFYRKENHFGVQIVENNRDFQEYLPIKIGNDVWIGARVTIMDGVNIGDGAVLATGSVITHDVPPYAIVGGVPAKTIRYRTTEENIKKFMDSKWWNKTPKEAYKLMS